MDVIVLRLYPRGKIDPIPACQALMENVLPAIQALGKYDTTVVDGALIVARDLVTGNDIHFAVERTAS